MSRVTPSLVAASVLMVLLLPLIAVAADGVENTPQHHPLQACQTDSDCPAFYYCAQWHECAPYHVTCGDGMYWDGYQCVCPSGTEWNGQECAESAVVIVETVTVTRTRTQTVVETSYTQTTQYITKSSKVTADYTETMTAQAQTTRVTLSDTITETLCSPMITTTLTVTKSSVGYAPGIVAAISFITALALLVPSKTIRARKKVTQQ